MCVMSRASVYLSPSDVRSGRAALHGCRVGLWISLLATRLLVHHLERERVGANAREQSLV